MSFDWICKQYGVPAKRGARVEYTGSGEPKLGTILSAQGGYVSVRLDGAKHALPFHPTWKLRYLEDMAVAP